MYTAKNSLISRSLQIRLTMNSFCNITHLYGAWIVAQRTPTKIAYEVSKLGVGTCLYNQQQHISSLIKCWRDEVSLLALGYNLVKCNLHSCHHLQDMKTLEWVKISVFMSGFVTTFICEQHTKDASNWYLSLQQTGHTALMLAAKAGHLNIVKKLITNGASLDITDKVNSLSTTGILNMWQCCVDCQSTVACHSSTY